MRIFNLKKLSERGAVMLETAVAMPFLIYIAFMGFELTRVSELLLAKRDITRALALTHTCGFRQTNSTGAASSSVDAATKCFQETINRVLLFSGSRFPDMSIYVQAYFVDDPANRKANCDSKTYNSVNVTRIAKAATFDLNTFDANNTNVFLSKVGLPKDTETGTVKTAIGSAYPELQEQLCNNGMITLIEFNVRRQPMFNLIFKDFSFKNGSTNNAIQYEFGTL